MNRRRFLLLVTAGALGSAIGVDTLMKQASASTTRYLYSANDNPEGGHFLTRLDLGRGYTQSRAVAVRGHAVLPLTGDKVLLFGRRPAFECAVVDFAAEHGVSRVTATSGRHFDGHGCLSVANDVFFTTENDYDGKRGVLGIRDSKTFQPIGEYDTHGLDPHDVHLMPDGKTLVIANGGIEQHPNFGRRKLNLDTMQPSLVYLDAESGQKIDEYRLPDHHLSIRHLLVTANGDVGAALQYEGNLYRQQPESLVAWQTRGGDLKLLKINPRKVSLFNGYMADLAYDPENQTLAVTSPRGNHVTFWDMRFQEFTHASLLTEPSGIAFLPESSQFLISNSSGDIRLFSSTQTQTPAKPSYRFPEFIWDNHLVVT